MRMTYKRVLIIIFACTIPLVLFFSSVQAYNFVKLRSEVRQMEARQKEWVEKNKKLIASIEVLRTPQRIEKIATEELGLHKIDKEHVRKVVIE
jgi:cell division protein FtsL